MWLDSFGLETFTYLSLDTDLTNRQANFEGVIFSWKPLETES